MANPQEQQMKPQAEVQAGGQEVQATPEENAMADAALRAALAPLASTDPNIAGPIDQQLQSSGAMPERNIAQMAIPLFEAGEKAAGGPIQDEDMLEHVAKNILDELIGQAIELGAVNLQQLGVNEDEFLEAVFIEFLIHWYEKHPDRADEEDKAALAELKMQRQQTTGAGQQPQSPPQQQTPIAQGVQQASRGSLAAARG